MSIKWLTAIAACILATSAHAQYPYRGAYGPNMTLTPPHYSPYDPGIEQQRDYDRHRDEMRAIEERQLRERELNRTCYTNCDSYGRSCTTSCF